MLESRHANGLTRRAFLARSAGTSLVMGFALNGTATLAAGAVDDPVLAPTVWYELDARGSLLVNVAKGEMGQHVGTMLARIVADELGADWSRVSIRHVDSDPRWGVMITGGSWSTFTSFKLMSQAGAAGRLVLIEAAGARFGMKADACHTDNGYVVGGDRRIAFAEIVRHGEFARTFTPEQLAELPIKSPVDRRMIGKPVAALDIPGKCTGTTRYGIDATADGVVQACPLLPPTRFGSVVRSVDDSAAREVAGYLGYEQLTDPSETLQGWVVVLGETTWAAQDAARRIKVDWLPGHAANVDENDLMAEGQRLVEAPDSGALLIDDGDVDTARAGAATSHDALYRTHTVLHFAMEPLNALAAFDGQTWHIHAGCQWQSLTLPLLARALEIDEGRIVAHQYALGGGFGRRLVGDFILPAALTAKAIGKPVRIVFPREADSRFDCVRSPSVQKLEASFDRNRNLLGVHHAAAAGWPTLTLSPFLLVEGKDGGTIDPFSISGADHWYTFPNHRVRAINNTLAHDTFQPGWLRGVGPGWTAWGVECFMDEMAAIAGVDPVDYRLSMLDASGKNAGEAPHAVGGAKRLAHVLRVVRERAQWGRPLPARHGQGVAVTQGQERTMPTWVACVAEVSVDEETGRVEVHRLTLAIDCGTVVVPDGALAQAESAALWGVSLALHEGTRFEAGQVADRNLGSYTPLRMADVPELDIHFVESTAVPVGLGEPPMLPVAPAIGNAIFRASGARVRDLPIRDEDVLRAIAAARSS